MASKKNDTGSPQPRKTRITKREQNPEAPPGPPKPQAAAKPPAAKRQAKADAVRPSAAAPRSRPTRKPPAFTKAPAGRPSAESQLVSAEPQVPSPGSLNILMVTSEAHPFAKTGGLAEVAAALPAALGRLGHSVTVVLPRYRDVAPEVKPAATIELRLGARTFTVGFVEQPMEGGVRAVLVDVPELFNRPGLYGAGGHDFPDNALRFAVLSRAALEYARLRGERLDLIHVHDWQTGLVPVYQKMHLSHDRIVGGVPVVFTIHNLAFQGIFGADALEAIGLGGEVMHPEALEYWGRISLLKGGINFSEQITTVSPTYAREILSPEFGFGMDGVLRRRSADLTGIVNGIDTRRWDPATDAFSPHFSAQDLERKRDAKRALLEEVGLPAGDAAMQRPLIGLISRLTDQKGFDLIATAAESLMALDAGWVMLGSGEPWYEELWKTMASRHPDRVSATIGFDERLAHLIEAGADIFLMPSRFEPCGLNQLYSLRYGTVPVVRATGGLDDTVIDADEPDGNGIKFAELSAGALTGAVRRALELFGDRARWQALQRAGMARDSSWDVSAREYVKVYGHARETMKIEASATRA